MNVAKSSPVVQGGSSFDDVTVELKSVGCSERSCQDRHPNIKTYSAVIRTTVDEKGVGRIKLHVIGAGNIWEESRAYDGAHLGGRIHKVENFLKKKALTPDRTYKWLMLNYFVFVEEVWLVKERRGRGRSLAALRAALVLLGLTPRRGIVLLQAGSTDESQFDSFEASEKLTRHWAKLGFGVWSDSDDAWLCLAFDDDVHGITALHGAA